MLPRIYRQFVSTEAADRIGNGRWNLARGRNFWLIEVSKQLEEAL